MKTGGNLGLGCWCLPAAGQPAGLCGPDTPGGGPGVCSVLSIVLGAVCERVPGVRTRI